MEIINTLIKSLFSGDSPNKWLFMKFVTAFLGGLSAFIFKQYHIKEGESKINFFWKGFWFTLISMFGGVFIIGPTTAFNAFVSGLIGWATIANVVKQENKGASNEKFIPAVLNNEQIQELFNTRNQ